MTVRLLKTKNPDALSGLALRIARSVTGRLSAIADSSRHWKAIE